MQRRRADSLHFTYVRFTRDLDEVAGQWEICSEDIGTDEIGRLWLPKMGWVRYMAPPLLRSLFENGGARIKGARVWRGRDAWRATVSFERLKKIKPAPDPGKLQDDAGRALALVYRLARQRFLPEFDEYFAPHKGSITTAEVRAVLCQQGFDLTKRGTSKLLREAGLSPKQLWMGGGNVQGYVARDIIRAWLDWRGLDWYADYEPGDAEATPSIRR
jgi:hypothetical protein